jgi:hypothetical protein
MEGDYKVAAKAKLDAAVLLEWAVNGSGFGETIKRFLACSAPPIYCRRSK